MKNKKLKELKNKEKKVEIVDKDIEKGTNTDSNDLELIKILLELEKEVRDRIDTSASMFGLIFSGGTYLVARDISLRVELLTMFVVIVAILLPYRLTIILSIVEKIEEIEEKLNIKIKYKKRNPYLMFRTVSISVLALIAIFTFFIRK